MTSSDQEWAIFYRQRFGASSNPSNRYYRSSIWSGIKNSWHEAIINFRWLVGDGHNISFWKDNWLGCPLVDSMNIPTEMHNSLLASVVDFISGSKWIIPSLIVDLFPGIAIQISKTRIPKIKDKLVWTESNDGVLSLRDAYSYVVSPTTNTNWCKKICSSSIPPKTFLIWRWLNKKMPTDDNIQKRGYCMVSMCSLCKMEPSLNDTLLAAITHIISTFWSCRNSARFEDKEASKFQALEKIKMATSLSGNTFKHHANGSLEEFHILKHLNVSIKYNRAPRICGGGIFRDHSGNMVAFFASYYGIHDALYAELQTAIKAIDIAFKHGWNSIWLECDSTLVVDIFNGKSSVPWHLWSKWNICKQTLLAMNLSISHIYREGNYCADKLANHGIASRTFSWLIDIPKFIVEDYNRNRLGLPNYRFYDL
ncbi:PREDICTED: uncharacterized protein LOC109341090 [Lupinus angustifolius]|uniref:uncharacterized protein LOC109341090 n=1 Tax=Lupinus angustifolius TaxID=3871 RepID=UPI00092E2CD7|nr:PREDICTED: uncharacterized protein LOC109341090 [Lupinus angustifolius]